MRENIDGKIYTLTMLLHLLLAVDPIEKKPLFHFYPGFNCFIPWIC